MSLSCLLWCGGLSLTADVFVVASLVWWSITDGWMFLSCLLWCGDLSLTVDVFVVSSLVWRSITDG